MKNALLVLRKDTASSEKKIIEAEAEKVIHVEELQKLDVTIKKNKFKMEENRNAIKVLQAKTLGE